MDMERIDYNVLIHKRSLRVFQLIGIARKTSQNKFYNNIDNLILELGYERKPEEWRLIIDSSKQFKNYSYTSEIFKLQFLLDMSFILRNYMKI